MHQLGPKPCRSDVLTQPQINHSVMYFHTRAPGPTATRYPPIHFPPPSPLNTSFPTSSSCLSTLHHHPSSCHLAPHPYTRHIHHPLHHLPPLPPRSPPNGLFSANAKPHHPPILSRLKHPLTTTISSTSPLSAFIPSSTDDPLNSSIYLFSTAYPMPTGSGFLFAQSRRKVGGRQ